MVIESQTIVDCCLTQLESFPMRRFCLDLTNFVESAIVLSA